VSTAVRVASKAGADAAEEFGDAAAQPGVARNIQMPSASA